MKKSKPKNLFIICELCGWRGKGSARHNCPKLKLIKRMQG